MNKKTVIGLMLLAAFTRESVAQSTPTASQFDQEHQHVELEREQMLDPNNSVSKAKKGAMSDSADIGREMRRVDRERKQIFDPNSPATKNVVNVFPNASTPGRAEIDIEALAKQCEQKAQVCRVDNLVIFTNFTTSAKSLKRIVSQADRVRASIVLCGLKNSSLKDTALTIKELGGQGGNVLVNPSIFTKYKVKAIPTMALTEAAATDQVDNKGCALPNNSVAVADGVSLDCALDGTVRCAPQFEAVASRYLRQIKGNR